MTHPRTPRFTPNDCQRCPLSKLRTQVVHGEGNPKPRAVFVGEAPGPDEDQQGRPFIGRAGKVLRASLALSGWDLHDIWITNTVKCFPHDEQNGKKQIRAPTPVESGSCRNYLDAELLALRAPLIVAVGKIAAVALTGNKAIQLDEDHGKTYTIHGQRVLVTFHPSGLHYSRGRAALFLADLRNALALTLQPHTNIPVS